MGKKGSWISAIKRLFRSNPLNHEGQKKKRFKHGSFFPFSREPSSIEQILGEIDQHNNHHHLFIPSAQPQAQSQSQPQPQPQPQSQQHPQSQPQPSSSSSGRPPVSPPPPPQRPRITSPKISHRPEPTLQQRHLSATRIQAAYRAYMARRNAGLVRLQRVVTSKSVKRQTVNAMKQMQLLVRVQTQIQKRRRIQMLENQPLKPQPNKNNPHKQFEDERWDDSLITKEEREARLQRKVDAAIKRERAMAYAYSHQLRKASSAPHKMGGYPWWWRWIQHQLPYHTPKNHHHHHHQFAAAASPSRSLETPTTPMSSRSTNRMIKGVYSMKDDDSLRSCPPFSVPNYMSPTASARAKARPISNPKERCVTPCSESSSNSRRFSSPFAPNYKSPGDDSSVGRKPFNRFV